jgi:hypothetical protein
MPHQHERLGRSKKACYMQQAAQYWITNKVEDRKDGCGETTAPGIKPVRPVTGA